MTKAVLRQHLLERRRTRSPALDALIVAHLSPVLRGRALIAGYAPLAGEPGGPDLPMILAGLVDQVLLPVLRADGDLDWAVHRGPLVAGRLGLREPPGPRLGPAAIARAQLVLVPALAVDRSNGTRLGRGGGSYDRALARVPADVPVIAVIDDDELLDEVPAEPHDRPVNAVLTPGYGLVRL